MTNLETFREYQGFDIASFEGGALEPVIPRQYRTLKSKTVAEFVEEVAEGMKVDPQIVRLWVMINRQNKTTRPDQPLMDSQMTMEEVYNKLSTRGVPLRLWAEIADTVEDGKPIWPDMQPQANNDGAIFVFLKYFDQQAQTLRGVDHVYVRKHGKVADIASHILEVMGWPAGTQLMLYEVSLACIIEILG